MKNLTVICLGLLTGCASVNLTAPNGVSATYSRVGTQSLKGVELIVEGNKTICRVESQTADSKDAILALENLGSDLAKASVK
jgi:hypothetical protein